MNSHVHLALASVLLSTGCPDPQNDCETLRLPIDEQQVRDPEALTSFGILLPVENETIAQFRQGLDDILPAAYVTLDLEEIEKLGAMEITEGVRARGSVVICYVSSGYEAWRNDADEFPESAKGGEICRDEDCDGVWKDEQWGNITSPLLHEFLGKRADRAVSAGCNGIEFDNMDQAFNNTGLDITPQQNVEGALQLASLAHERGLLIMAKNTGELAEELAPVFDGVFVEECHEHGGCEEYLPFRGKPVALVEYGAKCVTRNWAVCNEQTDYFDRNARRQVFSD